MVLLLPAVQADGPHVVGLAEPLALGLCELGASHPPTDEEVLALTQSLLIFTNSQAEFTGFCQKVSSAVQCSAVLSTYFVFMIGFVPPSTLASLPSPTPWVGAVVVPIGVATSLLLSTSSQLAPVVPVWSPLGLADQDHEEGEQEEGEEESHGHLGMRSGLRLYESTLFLGKLSVSFSHLAANILNKSPAIINNSYQPLYAFI